MKILKSKYKVENQVSCKQNYTLYFNLIFRLNKRELFQLLKGSSFITDQVMSNQTLNILYNSRIVIFIHHPSQYSVGTSSTCRTLILKSELQKTLFKMRTLIQSNASYKLESIPLRGQPIGSVYLGRDRDDRIFCRLTDISQSLLCTWDPGTDVP